MSLSCRKPRTSGTLIRSITIVILFCSHHSFATQFEPLGTVQGFDFIEVFSISGNGKAIFGISFDDDPALGGQKHSFRRSESTWTDLGQHNRLFHPYSTSHDGNVAVGYGYWSSDEGFDQIGTDIDFVPLAVSPDGSVFVGWGREDAAEARRAYRFAPSEGFSLLVENEDEQVSAASSVSDDGHTAVGGRSLDNGQTEIFRWTENDGVTVLATIQTRQIFPALTSSNGSVVVWTESFDIPFGQAHRWTSDAVVPLPDLTGGTNALSADGSIIVGSSLSRGSREAVVWHSSAGTRTINRLLDQTETEGAEGWEFFDVFGISDDGYVLTGNGRNPEGFKEPWELLLDRGDFDINGAFDANDIDALAAALRSGTPYSRYDLNADALIDAEDHRVLVEELTNTYFGDSNFDGEFNSSDLIAVFTAGQYDDSASQNSNWAQGDWNGDGEFDSGDLVLAFQAGGYEQGERLAANVPEPSSFCEVFGLLVILWAQFFRARRPVIRTRRQHSHRLANPVGSGTTVTS